MDPHQVQNFQNPMIGSQPPMQQQMQQQQYNPMLLQQQYMNNFPNFYGNNQVPMEFQQQQQYMNMFQQQQQQQQQQGHHSLFPQQQPGAPNQQRAQQQPQTQQHPQQQHALHQAQLLQQQQQPQRILQQQQHPQFQHGHQMQYQQQMQHQQQPQAPQPHQQQQQSSTMNHQQQLLLEQQRQMEQHRQQQALIEEQRLREQQVLQRQKEAQERAEAQRREQERLRREELEREEQRKKMEEAMRQAEEQRKREEKERLEKENLMRIRSEQLKKQKELEGLSKDMHGRMDNIGDPLSLIGTHYLSDLRSLIPMPCDNLAGSRLPIMCDHASMQGCFDKLNTTDIGIIAKILSEVDVNDIQTRQDNIELENNDLPLSSLPQIFTDIVNITSEAFDVEPDHNVEDLNMFDMQELVSDEPPKVLVNAAAASAAAKAHLQNIHDMQPSTSRDDMNHASANYHIPYQIDQQEAAKLRKQMISMGKGPKGKERKKRDMVESLYDSLTDFFDPSESHRKRRARTRTTDGEDEDEQLKRDLEEIARMEARERGDHPQDEDGSEMSETEMEGKTPKARKRPRKEEDRPPTPTEVIQQRDLEWNERQRKRQDKRKRRKVDGEDDEWNQETMAENDSYTRFCNLVEGVLDQVGDVELDIRMASNGKEAQEDDVADDEDIEKDLLIDLQTLEDVRNECQKLKSWKKLHTVPVDRLVKLVYLLERNMRAVISEDNSRFLIPDLFDEDGTEDEAVVNDFLMEKLSRGLDAAIAAMTIMTAQKMPKQVYIEDAIDRAINLCKHYLNQVVFPASDSVFRASAGKRRLAEEGRRKKKGGTNNRSRFVEHIYSKISSLVRLFAQLVRMQALPETSIHHLASLSISTFFVNNVGALQYGALSLASNIFSCSGDEVRTTMLTDILNSLHRLPPGKTLNNSHRFGADLWISNTTVLLMQLVQSAVKMPKRKKHDDEEKTADFTPDTIVKDSYREAQRLTGKFLQGFLAKCSCKGSKSEGEEDYRRIFDGFLQDLLVALYKPEWPAAEMILSLLGNVLVQHYRNKQTDMIIRQASLEYLGTITARLRKDTKMAVEDSDKRMAIVVKTLIFEEQEEDRYSAVDEVDISDMTTTDRLKKVEQALIDYLIDQKDDENVSVEYAVLFYAGEWYKETAEDLDMAKHMFKQDMKGELSDKERRKLEKKQDRMQEKGAAMKEFLVKLVDKKQMRKRADAIAKHGNVMLESDAAWTVKFLASRREFSHSFETYLRHILFGITTESTVGLRTKAMKCLTQIIEADHEVLGMQDVRSAVNSRMMDPNAAVREATIELLGKFLLVKEEFIPKYYSILLERIKDSGTAVRKRVIRIMREICEKYPDFEKIPDMLSKLVRRITDEDGVKKLVQDTFSGLWFQPCNERQGDLLVKKVVQMTAVAQLCSADSTIDFLEQLLHAVLKLGDRAMLAASKQIVDSLVDNILLLERNLATDASTVNAHLNGEDMYGAQLQKTNQDRLLACLTTLSIFSKVRPELIVRHAETLQPYLSSIAGTPAEQQVLNEVINMLERVAPLMNHPSDSFLTSLDESLANLAFTSGMKIVESAIRAASAVWHKFPRKVTAMAPKFLQVLRNLNSIRMQSDNDKSYQIPPNRMPLVQRYVFTIGLLARYFNFDQMLEHDEEAKKSLVVINLPPLEPISAGGDAIKLTDEDDQDSRRYRDNVFVLLHFFSRHPNVAIRQRAITSIGHICAQYADYLARPEVKNMYIFVLTQNSPEHLDMKIQTLRNLEMFLSNEDKKAIKSNQEWEKQKEQQNLKEMELSGSGLSSAVIQIYWEKILRCYFHPNEAVRTATVQVTCQTLNQGLVTPGASIPFLIAMTTDPMQTNRIKVENLLKEIDTKYTGMVQSKAIHGVRVAYKLNALIRTKNQLVRGIRACEASVMTHSKGNDEYGLPKMTNDGQAILSSLYTSLRANRGHRRSFLNSILRLFSEDSRERLDVGEWIWVADNVAMFPYQVLDEPLYVIRQIDGILSISGQTIVNHFKEALTRPGMQQPEDDDTFFESESLFQRFPEDKTSLFNLMLSSQACFILLYLKNFLMKLYGFSEQKVQEYSPSEAAKVYEKAVTRKNVTMFKPDSALQELNPQVIAERNSLQGQWHLAHKISNFRKMLLSLDRVDEDEDALEDGGITEGITEREDDLDEDESMAQSDPSISDRESHLAEE